MEESTMAAKDEGVSALTTLTVTVLFGGVALTLFSAGSGRCAGTPRSVRLKFQQRQAAIQQQMAAAEAGGTAAPVPELPAPVDESESPQTIEASSDDPSSIAPEDTTNMK